MQSADSHHAAVLASGLGTFSIEWDVVGFAVLMSILLVAVRAKRAHNQKLRRAASSGFYDFDVARYSSAGSSLNEPAPTHGVGPLAPSFVSASRGGAAKAKRARGASPVPVPVPSSFGAADRSIVGPVPAFDQATAIDHRPRSGEPGMPALPGSPKGVEPAGAGLPIPSTPRLPATLASTSSSADEGETVDPSGAPSPLPAPESSLPLLVQPPPPPRPAGPD